MSEQNKSEDSLSEGAGESQSLSPSPRDSQGQAGADVPGDLAGDLPDEALEKSARSLMRPLDILRGDAKAAAGSQLNGLGRKDASAGITFGVTMVLFTLLGHWLDGKWETSPLFLIGGAALGGVSGFIYLVETVSPGTLFRSRKEWAQREAHKEAQKRAEPGTLSSKQSNPARVGEDLAERPDLGEGSRGNKHE